MIQNQIAKKYSKALFSLAEEKDEFIKFQDDLNLIKEAFTEHKEFRNVLFHPRIKLDEKKRIFDRVFEEEISQEIYNFIQLLIDKRRIFYIKAIINKFNELVNDREKIIKIEVVSAIELEEDMKNRLKDKLEKGMDYDVILNNTVDPDILGGLVLKIGDKIIDGSIQHELNTLSEKIEKIPVSKLGVEWYESETRRN